MNPEILTVHNIKEAIDHAGVFPFANRLIQEMAGEYFFVDAMEIYQSDILGLESYGWTIEQISSDDADDPPVLIAYKILPVPMKVAHFVVNVIKGVSSLINIDFDGPEEKPSMKSVYLMPGTVLFGNKIEKVTEIPADVLPVVVEKF